MSPPENFVLKIWRKLRRRRRSRKEPVRLQSASSSPPPIRKEVPGIEPLEGRIAPATLVNPSTLTFTDFEGDFVTVKFSKPIFPNSGNPRAAAGAANEQVFPLGPGAIDDVTAGYLNPLL